MDSNRSKTARKQPSRASAEGPARRAEPSDQKGAVRRTASIEERLGEELRALYEDVLTQPIPDRFIELLNKLDAGRN